MEEIERALRQGEMRDRFELFCYRAVQPTDLQRCLLQHRPHIVHFSGHGDAEGIHLQGEYGWFQTVPGDLLERLFEHFRGDLRCVVLNSDSSAQQARAIARAIDCVIGMGTPISDAAAIRFSVAFYQALACGQDVKAAFEQGRFQINLPESSGEGEPELVAERCDPARVVLLS